MYLFPIPISLNKTPKLILISPHGSATPNPLQLTLNIMREMLIAFPLLFPFLRIIIIIKRGFRPGSSIPVNRRGKVAAVAD